MFKFYSCAIVGAAVFAMTLGTPSRSEAQAPANNEPAAYPLGNRIFDRWIDNRRATRGRVIPQLVESPYSYGNPDNRGIFPYYPTGTPGMVLSPSQPSVTYSQVVPATVVQPATTPEVMYYDTTAYPIARGRFFLFRRR
jgi:hypothetical protein